MQAAGEGEASIEARMAAVPSRKAAMEQERKNTSSEPIEVNGGSAQQESSNRAGTEEYKFEANRSERRHVPSRKAAMEQWQMKLWATP